jgi:hypothetical protein
MLVLRQLVLTRFKLLRMKWKLLLRQLRLLNRNCHFLFRKIWMLSFQLVSIPNQEFHPCNVLILPQHCSHLMTRLASMTIKILFFSPRIHQQTQTYSRCHLTSISSKLMKQSSVMSLLYPTSTTLRRVSIFIAGFSKRANRCKLYHHR